MSSPSKIISPFSTTPLAASRPIIEYIVCDLPLPDSPTIPITSPSFRESDTSLTALTLPWSVLNDVVKFLISNNDI